MLVNFALYQSSAGFADPRKIKLGTINALANALTRYAAKRANSPHSF
jgi:hypothetical protein